MQNNIFVLADKLCDKVYEMSRKNYSVNEVVIFARKLVGQNAVLIKNNPEKFFASIKYILRNNKFSNQQRELILAGVNTVAVWCNIENKLWYELKTVRKIHRFNSIHTVIYAA